jgi:hypothetical protein
MRPFYSGCEAIVFAQNVKASGRFSCLITAGHVDTGMRHKAVIGRDFFGHDGAWGFWFVGDSTSPAPREVAR